MTLHCCWCCVQVFLRGGQMAVLDTMRTDIMHKAAVTIQRHVRGFMVRRQTQRTRRAIIKIQVPHPVMHFPCPLLTSCQAALCSVLCTSAIVTLLSCCSKLLQVCRTQQWRAMLQVWAFTGFLSQWLQQLRLPFVRLSVTICAARLCNAQASSLVLLQHTGRSSTAMA